MFVTTDCCGFCNTVDANSVGIVDQPEMSAMSVPRVWRRKGGLDVRNAPSACGLLSSGPDPSAPGTSGGVGGPIRPAEKAS